MCDLLCLSFNTPVDIRISFDNFVFKDRINPSGWGIAWFDNGTHVLKDYTTAQKSSKTKEFARKNPKSDVFISHVRAASCGRQRMENTHPFKRTYGGCDYVFAHNGTVQLTTDTDGPFEPEGETDSEQLFCQILNQMCRQTINSFDASSFEWLQELLCTFNNYGSMNIAFSDGSLLFCYSDVKGYNQFSYIHRHAPFDTIKLLDKSIGCGRDCFVELAEEKDPSQEGFILATTERTGQPTDESWRPLTPGTLTVFKNGNIVFSR